jgi:hypothetical protein
MWLIYILTAPSGKQYVGQTRNSIDWRLRKHWMDAQRGSNLCVHKAMRKYGLAAFKVEIVSERLNTRQEADAAEIAAIATFDTLRPAGYNLTLGGSGSCQSHCKRGHLLAETRIGNTSHCRPCRQQETKEANIGRKEREAADPEYKAANRAYWKEWRARQRQDPNWVEKKRKNWRDNKQERLERCKIDPEFKARYEAASKAANARRRDRYRARSPQ